MLAETRINRDLRVRSQQTIVSGTTSGQQITLPSDFRQMEAFIVTVAGIETALKPTPPDRSTNRAISPIPDGYWIGGNTLYLNCNTDYSYRMVYFSGVPSLSASNTQNWLIQQDASVYLYASLLEAAAYMQDDDRIGCQTTIRTTSTRRNRLTTSHTSSTVAKRSLHQPTSRTTPPGWLRWGPTGRTIASSCR